MNLIARLLCRRGNWFQFRLRTLLVVITLIALLMPWSVPFANEWIAYYRMTERERKNEIISATPICGYEVNYRPLSMEEMEEEFERLEKFKAILLDDEPNPVTLP